MPRRGFADCGPEGRIIVVRGCDGIGGHAELTFIIMRRQRCCLCRARVDQWRRSIGRDAVPSGCLVWGTQGAHRIRCGRNRARDGCFVGLGGCVRARSSAKSRPVYKVRHNTTEESAVVIGRAKFGGGRKGSFAKVSRASEA